MANKAMVMAIVDEVHSSEEMDAEIAGFVYNKLLNYTTKSG